MKISTEITADRTSAKLTLTQNAQTIDADCNPAEIDAMIADLVALRERMSPARKVELTPGETPVFECDNLLWDTQPAPARRGVMLAMYHGGLGWVTVSLSRAQLEDLVTDIEFSLVDLAQLPGFQNRAVETGTETRTETATPAKA